jgi:hypothetical protein
MHYYSGFNEISSPLNTKPAIPTSIMLADIRGLIDWMTA